MTFTVYDDGQQQQAELREPQLRENQNVPQVQKSFDPNAADKYQDKENAQSQQELERAEHELCIERGELRCTPSEQLDRWIDYIKWSQRAGCGKQQVLELLERCTKTFKADRSLRDQRKYLRVWINYADMSCDKEGVFEYMWANKIGTTHALYYEAASAMHETGKGTLDGEPDMKRAMKMLAVGIKMQADPVDRLHLRKKELKRRALRRLQKERSQRMGAMSNTMQVVAEEEAESERVAVVSKHELTEDATETTQEIEQLQCVRPKQCQEPQAQRETEAKAKPESVVTETSSPQHDVIVESTSAPVPGEQAEASKVFDVTCDECSAECSEESWRIDQADEDLCPACYLNRQNGDGAQRASVRGAVRQKDGQNIATVAKACSSKSGTVTKKKQNSGRKPLAEKQSASNKLVVQKQTVAKRGKHPGQNPKSVGTALGRDDENVDDADQGSEPWVGTKKAKARRRKRLYKPTFDGDAPSAEDGGFSLFTDKNGRDCR